MPYLPFHYRLVAPVCGANCLVRKAAAIYFSSYIGLTLLFVLLASSTNSDIHPLDLAILFGPISWLYSLTSDLFLAFLGYSAVFWCLCVSAYLAWKRSRAIGGILYGFAFAFWIYNGIAVSIYSV